ncbi:MAG: hypothetical protein PSX81_00665 [bacterium]|nr:hypothetical protein [bacterium]
MENETEINAKILAILRVIQEKTPELMKYINEMPVTIPNEKEPEINARVLNDYYKSLSDMLSNQYIQKNYK